MIETRKPLERTILVAFSHKTAQKNTAEEDALNELNFLAETAGAYIIKTFFQQRSSYDTKYLIGKGKVSEIAEFVDKFKIQLVIFENELSPTQIRNLEQKIKCKIIDKAGLILDIFALNARTAQAKLQVELAQLQYLLPRLTRQWTHLSKQYGGIGTKGPGETQIETDRRLISKRISVLKEKLKKIESQRKTQAAERKNFFRVSLVGYTNVGKSTLLNALTDSKVYVENKLFATLDTSTRTLQMQKAAKNVVSHFPKKVLISDTVGFIRNLPHDLIESFKSTLSEAVESDVLLHIVDISNPSFEEQMEVVNNTLNEIGAAGKKIILVFNKVDKISAEHLSHIRSVSEDAVFISAQKGIGINKIIERLSSIFSKDTVTQKETLRADDYKRLNDLYNSSEVKEVKYKSESIEIKYKVKQKKKKPLHNEK